MMLKIFNNFEVSIDFHQWMIGFNYYKHLGGNIFFGPIRFGFEDKSWGHFLNHLIDIAYKERKQPLSK